MPDIETVRQIAFALAIDHDIHERAMADPFALEAEMHELARQLQRAVGLPSDVRIYGSDR